MLDKLQDLGGRWLIILWHSRQSDLLEWLQSVSMVVFCFSSLRHSSHYNWVLLTNFINYSMANQSKAIFADHFKNIVLNVMLGSRKNKAVTFSIIVIISFLLYMRNTRVTSDNIKLRSKIKKVRWGISRREERAMSIRSSSKESNISWASLYPRGSASKSWISVSSLSSSSSEHSWASILLESMGKLLRRLSKWTYCCSSGELLAWDSLPFRHHS